MRKTIIAILAVLLLIGLVACNADVNSQLFGKKINIKFATIIKDNIDTEVPSITFEKGETWADVATKITSEEKYTLLNATDSDAVTLFDKTFKGTTMISFTYDSVKYTGAFVYLTEQDDEDEFEENNIYLIMLNEYTEGTGARCLPFNISSADYKVSSDATAFINGIPTTTDAIVNDGTYYITVLGAK